MAAESRKAALLKTLLDEYGISSSEQLLEAIRKMKKLDITQFVFSTTTGGKAHAN